MCRWPETKVRDKYDLLDEQTPFSRDGLNRVSIVDFQKHQVNGAEVKHVL